MRRCAPGGADVRESPSETSELLFRIEPSEEFALLDVTGRWAWGYRRSDHSVGYLLAECLLPVS